LLTAAGLRALYRPPRPVTEQELVAGRIQVLERAVEASPGDLNARLALAESLSSAGRTDAYLEQLQAVLALDPTNDDARESLASAYLARKDGTSAEEHYRKILQRDPRNAMAQNGLTMSYLYQRRSREALASARKALALKPADPLLQFGLGWAAMQRATVTRDQAKQQRHYSIAVEQFERVARLWRRYPNLHFHLGSCYAKLQNNNLAVRHLEQAVKQMPGDPRPVVLLARAYKSGTEREKALALMEDYVARHPDNAEAQDLLGELLVNSVKPEDRERMIKAHEAAVRLAPKRSAYCLHLGAAYLRTADLKEASLAYSEAARLDPNDPTPFQQLAAVYTRLGDPDRAARAAELANKLVYNEKLLQELEMRAQLHPREVGTHLMLADRYRELKSHSAAQDEYEAVLEVDPANKRAAEGLRQSRMEMTREGAP